MDARTRLKKTAVSKTVRLLQDMNRKEEYRTPEDNITAKLNKV